MGNLKEINFFDTKRSLTESCFFNYADGNSVCMRIAYVS